jgi:hypothetical protein
MTYGVLSVGQENLVLLGPDGKKPAVRGVPQKRRGRIFVGPAKGLRGLEMYSGGGRRCALRRRGSARRNYRETNNR